MSVSASRAGLKLQAGRKQSRNISRCWPAGRRFRVLISQQRTDCWFNRLGLARKRRSNSRAGLHGRWEAAQNWSFCRGLNITQRKLSLDLMVPNRRHTEVPPISVSSSLLTIHICQWVSRHHPDEFRLIPLQSGCLIVVRCVHRIKKFATCYVPTSSQPIHPPQTRAPSGISAPFQTSGSFHILSQCPRNRRHANSRVCGENLTGSFDHHTAQRPLMVRATRRHAWGQAVLARKPLSLGNNRSKSWSAT